MTSRQRDRVVLALVAALHLVVQPLAATAWCALVSGWSDAGCCCRARSAAEEPRGCCGHADEGEDAGDDSREERPCRCAVTGDELPATPPEAGPRVDDARHLAMFDAAVFGLRRPGSLGGVRPRNGRGAAPGDRPPKYLFLQVFRL